MTTANFAPKQRGRLSLAACKNYAAKAIFSTHIRKPLAISITIGLLFGTIGTASAALSAVTAKTIQGTAPYIKLNGTPLTNISELLSIQIGGDTYTSDASGNMQKVGATGTFTTPITTATKFSDVTAIVTADGYAHVLSTDIPSSDQVDIDGDSPITLTGNVTATWKDQFGTTITTLSDPLKLCYSNYTLELKTTGTPSIETQYGDPRLTTYGNATALFKFSVPTTRIEPCWAKPDMTYATGQYAGPATMWDPSRGFIPQAYSAPWGANFPTTGADGLYFDLTFAGASSVPSWNLPGTVNGITVKLSNFSLSSVRVTLERTATTAPGTSSTWTAPFTLHGTDGDNDIDYGFTIQHWFQPGLLIHGTVAAHIIACNNSGYKLPTVAQLTNASGTAWNLGGTIPAYGAGASSGNYHTRAIGRGLFSEWGFMQNYGATNFTGASFTSDVSGVLRFAVGTGWGNAGTYKSDYKSGAACIFP